jgi:hypothetical protein
MRSLPSRLSDWVLVHPVLWCVGSGAVLVLLGFALSLEPIVVIAAGAAIGVLNILHAKRRGYLPTSGRVGSSAGTGGGRATLPGTQRRLIHICPLARSQASNRPERRVLVEPERHLRSLLSTKTRTGRTQHDAGG